MPSNDAIVQTGPPGLIWTGAADDLATNPQNWALSGSPGVQSLVAPQPNDGLVISGGTITVTGDGLNGDTLTIDYSTNPAGTTLNLENGTVSIDSLPDSIAGSPTINTYGSSTLNVLDPEPSTFSPSININEGQLQINGSMQFINANITGAPQVGLDNTGTMTFAGGTNTINPNLLGFGHIDVSNAVLTVSGSVTTGTETFDLTGAAKPINEVSAFVARPSPTATLNIDQTYEFDATVNVNPNGLPGDQEMINLLGLHADSYTFGSNTLRLFSGGNDIFTMENLHNSEPMTVSQGSVGVALNFGATLPGVPAGNTEIGQHFFQAL